MFKSCPSPILPLGIWGFKKGPINGIYKAAWAKQEITVPKESKPSFLPSPENAGI